ncbi:hypothetical protein [Kitasatospora sp. NPDC050543]|uniref:hypothetical protein n=1 Tax=Kitasatospora sp. NPDC050543 TaxID=3364054 RepID=UPI0037B4D09F
MTLRVRPRPRPRSGRTFATAAVSLALLGVLATAAPSSAAAADSVADGPAAGRGVRVSGAAGTTLTQDFGEFAGDAVRIELDARAAVNGSPTDTRGRFHVVHRKPDGQLVADFEGTLGCLVVGGRDAIATGVVTSGTVPRFPDLELIGSKVAITVQDNGRADRLGWVWGGFGQPVADCQGTVPFIRTTSGNYAVRG